MAGVLSFFFRDFVAYYFRWERRTAATKRARAESGLTTSYRAKGEEFRPDLSAKLTKEHGRRWSGIWHPPEWNLVTENARALERRNSVTGM